MSQIPSPPVLTAAQIRNAGKVLMHASNYSTGFTGFVHPSLETDLRELQTDRTQQRIIRRAIKMNERKARSQSGKHRGRKWLLSKQAQCAIYGHEANHFKAPGVCIYCGYEFE